MYEFQDIGNLAPTARLFIKGNNFHIKLFICTNVFVSSTVNSTRSIEFLKYFKKVHVTQLLNISGINNYIAAPRVRSDIILIYLFKQHETSKRNYHTTSCNIVGYYILILLSIIIFYSCWLMLQTVYVYRLCSNLSCNKCKPTKRNQFECKLCDWPAKLTFWIKQYQV